MLPVFVVLCCPVNDVELSDADAFQIPPAVVRAQWNLAREHPAKMRNELIGWNLPSVVCEWEQECEWRARCWDKLDDVLFCQMSDTGKLRSLAMLKMLIGHEAYFAGQMPSPIPTYRRP